MTVGDEAVIVSSLQKGAQHAAPLHGKTSKSAGQRESYSFLDQGGTTPLMRA